MWRVARKRLPSEGDGKADRDDNSDVDGDGDENEDVEGS